MPAATSAGHYYVVERATGKFAGYSETVWNPNRPEQLRQDMTGVFPQYRGKGLGRWLKAAMLEKVLRERPQVKFVRTGNADFERRHAQDQHRAGLQALHRPRRCGRSSWIKCANTWVS